MALVTILILIIIIIDIVPIKTFMIDMKLIDVVMFMAIITFKAVMSRVFIISLVALVIQGRRNNCSHHDTHGHHELCNCRNTCSSYDYCGNVSCICYGRYNSICGSVTFVSITTLVTIV